MKRGFLNSSKAKNALSSPYETWVAPPAPLVIKPPYGQVQNAGRPEGYTAAKRDFHEVSAEVVDYPEDGFVITIIPQKDMADTRTRAEFPDGWTECLLKGSAKRNILMTPGFPQPLLRPPHINHRIGPTPNMGLGMFATRALKMGELILSERPLIVTPRMMDAGLKYSKDFTREQVVQATLFEWEKTVEICFNRMLPTDQEAFLALANSHTEDGSGRLTGIIRTNGFGIRGLGGGGSKQASEDMYSIVCQDMSRINHSCSPNVTRMFDKASFSYQLRAARNIQKGKQLFTDYCDILEPAAERQKSLAPYGVKCVCDACSCSSGASDSLRSQLTSAVKQIEADFGIWLWNTSFADDYVITSALKWIGLVEKEGLQSEAAYGQLLAVVFNSYVILGDQENAAKYGKLTAASHYALDGEKNPFKSLVDPTHCSTLPQWNTRSIARAKAKYIR